VSVLVGAGDVFHSQSSWLAVHTTWIEVARWHHAGVTQEREGREEEEDARSVDWWNSMSHTLCASVCVCVAFCSCTVIWAAHWFCLPDLASSHWVHLLCLDYFVCVRFFFCTCMLYFCNMVRWAWFDWGLSRWLTTLLQCFDTVGWVIRPVTRKPSWRWQTRATRKPAKNCSNSTCLQPCRWQY